MPATSEKMKILTISGWTQPSDALLGIAPGADVLDYFAATDVRTAAGRLPAREYDRVIGWSLGGILAREMIADGLLKADRLISLASPYQFVRTPNWPHAMPPETFELFTANYRDDTQRTVNRFHGLVAKGDTHARRIMGELSHHPHVLETDLWLPWMDFLRSYSADGRDYTPLPPTLIVHGTADAIVPVQQVEPLALRIPNQKTEIWDNAGHALHHHDPIRLRKLIEEFV